MEKITDQDIVARVLHGNIDSFRHLVERYQQPVSKLIYFKLKDSSDVDDLTQETFIRAYKYLHSYNPSKSRS